MYFQKQDSECLTFKLMKMKTRKKFSISFTIITLLIAGLFVSCQQGENIDEKVQSEVEDLRDNLNDLSVDDSNFADNLHSELEDFEKSMNDLKEDMNESGEQISMEARQAVNDLQAEARSLRMKIENRTQVDENEGLFSGSENEDAVSGDATAQAQRDTTIDDTTRYNEQLSDDVNRVGQEIQTEFQDFKQNVDQWVDRLSASVEGS